MEFKEYICAEFKAHAYNLKEIAWNVRNLRGI